jgi:hypothetical protein
MKACYSKNSRLFCFSFDVTADVTGFLKYCGFAIIFRQIKKEQNSSKFLISVVKSGGYFGFGFAPYCEILSRFAVVFTHVPL